VLAIDDILGPGGAVARRLGDRYEPRPQQLAMAHAVESAFAGNAHLLVEAGTGVGKSFAYLVPAIIAATQQKKRVVISTCTISLQEQLIEKDIPLLQSLYPDEFTAVLVKGRNNYLCKRRLHQAIAHREMLFEGDKEGKSLGMIRAWSETTTEGSLASLPVLPAPGVWDEARAEHGNCLGKRCSFYEGCFWQAAKRRMNGGNILVVNHALFFSDLALRSAGVQYLPRYDLVVFDEAHTIEDVAGQHFAIRMSETSVRYQLRQLYDARKGKGLLKLHGSFADASIQAVLDVDDATDIFFKELSHWNDRFGRSNGRVNEANIIATDLPERLVDASKSIKSILKQIEQPEQMLELSSKADRLAQAGETLRVLLDQSMPDAVYWIDQASRRSNPRLTLSAAPVDVSAGLRRHLFEQVKSVVLTSATICTGSTSDRTTEADAVPGPFRYIARRLGLDTPRTMQLGSPFNYEDQATMYVETNLPDPNDLPRFMPAACERIEQYVRKTHGGAFVLFTSFNMLRDAADRLRSTFEFMGLPVLVQGVDGSPRQLIERFRALDDCVLFGTTSFWQGVDVQGERLRNVIIVKLPFSVPDEPLLEAKLEHVQRSGGNPFMDLSLPEAVIRFKQGFGRLIRSNTDKGIVVVLDSRVKTKRYGRAFLSSLPPVRTIEVTD
jgi:ATP-dependent DNA helicase DinG